MTFSVSTLKGVKVYNLTFGKTSDQWKEEQRAGHIHSLRYNEAYRRRVEFIQDAVFPTSSLQVEMSDDGQWLLATGVYPPKLKMFELSELSVKFERGLESEPIDFCFLSADWHKFVVLREHRWMEFHSSHGKHYNMRLPLMGTCLAYNKPMCELYTGTVQHLVLRANLEEGRYLAPLETSLEYIACADTDRTHLLSAFGGTDGRIECWDPRAKACVATLDLYDSVPSLVPTPEVSKLRFGHDGLSLAAGLSTGHTALYDLRRRTPLHVLNQRNKLPICDIRFHAQASKLVTCDAKTIRYWEQSTGALYTAITPAEPVNNVALVQGSGVVFVAQEQHRVGAYYLPSVGVAPSWCPFLDAMTEVVFLTCLGVVFLMWISSGAGGEQVRGGVRGLQVRAARRAGGAGTGAPDGHAPAPSLHARLLHGLQAVPQGAQHRGPRRLRQVPGQQGEHQARRAAQPKD